MSVQIVEAYRTSNKAEEYVSISKALKLVTPFSGNKRQVLTFISNVDAVFKVINPEHEGRMYKFMLTRISGEPRIAKAHRNLDFHATQLFKAKQEKLDSVSEWVKIIQTPGSKFREVALIECDEDERALILTLSDKLRNICFVQGLFMTEYKLLVVAEIMTISMA
jgi:hypothetical protein